MYEALALVLAGEAVLFRSWTLAVYCGCVLLCFHLFVLLYEEPTLRRMFGASYETYCREVPRWIPGRRGGYR
jgi:protein-S-isoprenylcysteine O-methyltransferase Ste14